ncbi:D-glucuronyl C5-epimerase family protein [Streptomyces sp. NPDC006270]|uniref:D-glucuronyl C5-epimerase family protein n=1 Tax=Streptomyces sp. NPDC006270 TaxID=3364741 RepID=UPI003679CB3F
MIRTRFAATAVAALMIASGCTMGDKTPEEAGTSISASREKAMPAFSDGFSYMAEDFYKIAWTEDGYPGKNAGDGTVYEHPIYPTYVLQDYLKQYQDNPTPALKKALSTVAHAAVDRMVPHENSLVFWYEPGGGSRLYERHYSALTQGYYANRLHDVGALLKDQELLDAAEKAFLALTVPAEKDGVLYRDSHGVSIAEVPQQPNSYILNGWQSALASSWQYWLASGDERARDLVLESSRTMAKLLPLYDAPDVANSRYGLTGFLYVRTVGSDLEDVTVSVPGEGDFGLASAKEPSRWQNHRVDKRQVNLVLSKASFPKKNTLSIDVSKSTAVEAYVGEYDPLSSSPVKGEWIEIGRVGPDSPDLQVPWDVVNKTVYPTNFVKKIDSKNTNVYHSVHVKRLTELAEATKLQELQKWADRWADAMCRWDSLPQYEGLYARPVAGIHEPGTERASLPVEDICADH